jgi:hypothetical protein
LVYYFASWRTIAVPPTELLEVSSFALEDLTLSKPLTDAV